MSHWLEVFNYARHVFLHQALFMCGLEAIGGASHEAVEELNLDLVQFPSPVVVEEVRSLKNFTFGPRKAFKHTI